MTRYPTPSSSPLNFVSFFLSSKSVYQVTLLSHLSLHTQSFSTNGEGERSMKKINQLILRKCKSLSRQLGRSSSYSNLRSKSAREVELWCGMQDDPNEPRETIIVGSSRKRYLISSKHLSHPLLNALIQKSSSSSKLKPGDRDGVIQVKCEVVLFDHLLWMLDNVDPSIGPESLEELAELYVF